MTQIRNALSKVLDRRPLLLLGFLFAPIGNIGNALFAEEAPNPNYTKIEGSFQIYYPEKKWASSGLGGLSKPLPFQLVLGDGREFSAYCNLIDWYDVGGNPLSTGLIAKDATIYTYSTNLAEDQKMGDIPVGLGKIEAGTRIPAANRYEEILYLACNNHLLATWSNELLRLDMFYGLRSQPDLKIRTQNRSEGNIYEWGLWLSAEVGGKTIEWCEYDLRVVYNTEHSDTAKHPQEVYFVIRSHNPFVQDPRKSEVYCSYKFTTKTAARVNSFPATAIQAEDQATKILVTDHRGRPDGPKQAVSYILYKGDNIPFSANSPVVLRASTYKAKAQEKSNTAVLTFAIATAAGICLMEYHRRNKTKTYKNEKA